jgi:glycosyltransferase involved in cell wall biosynthesis
MSIALALIARDEARCIARCLRSAAPHVDELLVVDTGSRDDTRAIAAACGARVLEFAWRDDFAAARNHALAQLDTDWVLMLDADEWIEAGGATLRPIDQAGTAPFVGQVQILEAAEPGVARLPPLWVSRWLPRGVHYAGRVHEQPQHALPLRRLELQVGHDGYLAAQRERKAGRNEALLRRALQETPGNAYLHYQLGREREIRADYAQADDQYARAAALLGWPPALPAQAAVLQARHPWLHDLVVRQLFSRKRAGRHAAGLAQARAEAPLWAHSPDFHFAAGDLLLDAALAQPAQAAELLPWIEASWLRCLALGETPQLDGAIAGRGSYLAAHNLAVFHRTLGHAEQAAQFERLAQARPGAD